MRRDTLMQYEGISITLIDTAGIRGRRKIEPGVEKFSVLRSMQAIERADVSLLMVDATSGITNAGYAYRRFILEAWKSTVVLVNKWDVVPKDTYTMDEYTQQVRQALNFMDYVPVLFISALTGQRVEQVLPIALQVQEERLVRLSNLAPQPYLARCAGADAALGRRTPVQDLLRQPGAHRSTDLFAARQRPQAAAFQL